MFIYNFTLDTNATEIYEKHQNFRIEQKHEILPSIIYWTISLIHDNNNLLILKGHDVLDTNIIEASLHTVITSSQLTKR